MTLRIYWLLNTRESPIQVTEGRTLRPNTGQFLTALSVTMHNGLLSVTDRNRKLQMILQKRCPLTVRTMRELQILDSACNKITIMLSIARCKPSTYPYIENATRAKDKEGSPNNKLLMVPISATGKQPHYWSKLWAPCNAWLILA